MSIVKPRLRRALAASSPALLLFTLHARDAHAFKPIGHDAIEAKAYQRLLAMPAVPGHDGVTGKRVLEALIERGVLDAPTCFHAACDDGAPTATPGQWMPVVASGQEDLWLAHQFSSTEQCFHFMAPPSDVYDSDAKDPHGAPILLAQAAPRRCMRFVNGLVDEIARPETRGDHRAYVLIHAISDSFSGAHAVRDERDQWRLAYLKPWHLTALLPYVLHPSGWSYWSPDYHHKLVDEADDAWLAASPGCEVPPEDALYALPEDCLTPRAKAAVDAVVLALVALYEVTDGATSRAESPAWSSALARVAGGDGRDVDLAGPEPGERAWSPDVLVAATLGTYTSVRRTEAAGRLQLEFPSLTQFAPLVASARGDIGVAHGADAGLVLRSPIVGFELPVMRGLAVGVPELQLEIVRADTAPAMSVTSTLFSLDVFPVDGLWVGLTAGHYSLATGVLDPAPTMLVGYAADLDAPPVRGSAAYASSGARPTRGRGRAALAATGDAAWDTPTSFGAPRPRIRYWSVYLSEIGFRATGGSGALYGQQVLWALARTPSRPVLSIGGHLSVGGMQESDTAYVTGRLAASVRWTIADVLALESEPVVGFGGVSPQAKSDPFSALEAMPLAVVFTPGNLQVAIDGPSARWSDWGDLAARGRITLVHGTEVGLRIGVHVD